MSEPPPVLSALKAIASGEAVDWTGVESTATDEASRDLVRQLRDVADIAEFHRRLHPATAVAESLPDGSVWGALTIRELVGRGSFGRVYRARDPRLDRDVALKLLDRRHEGDDVSTMVIEEGRVLARLRHPNIVAIHGADRADGHVGLWMEFVSGRTLDRIVREQGPLGADEAALVGRDVCRALAAIHRAGLVHRDVKAQNVMREAGGRVLLMDLGAGRDAGEVQPGGLAGTPLYLAPEVLAGAPATPRSDLYSLGVLLYYLVTGAFPVHAQSVNELRTAHAESRRTRLRDARPDLPEPFIQVVDRALAPGAADRFDSAGSFEAALSEALGHDDRAIPARAPTRRMWLAASLFAAGLVGLTAWIMWPVPAPVPQVARWTVPLEHPLVTPSAPGSAEFTLSPDGSRLVYSVVVRGGDGEIHIRPIDAFQSTTLAGIVGGQPFVSPDGRWVGYHHTEPQGGKLIKTLIAGGPAIPLADWSNPAGASWDGDKTIVFSGDGDLWRVGDEPGATPNQLTHVDHAKGESAIRPQALPGGAVLFTLRRRSGDSLAVLTRTGVVNTLVDRATNAKYLPPGYVVFVRGDWIMAAAFDARRLEAGLPVQVEAPKAAWFDVSAAGSLVFSAPTEGVAPDAARLVWVERQGGRQVPLPPPLGASGARFLPGTLRLSPKGDHLSLALAEGAPEVVGNGTIGRLWIGDLARGTLAAITTELVRPLAWTPDGARVTYMNAAGAIAWKRIDGTSPEEILAAPEAGPFDRCTAGSWSPDGRLLVLACADGSKALTWPPADAAGRAPRAVKVEPFGVPDVPVPVFSPDGRCIAYQAGVVGMHNSQRVFVRAFPGAGPVIQVSNGNHPIWRGGELFFLPPPGGMPAYPKMPPMVVPIETEPDCRPGQPRRATESFPYDMGQGFAAGARSLDVSADGRRFLVLDTGGQPAPHALTQLKVVLHWVEDVKRKVATGK
jgi:serine/threonine-protein kinase